MTTAQVARIGRSYTRPATPADEDNRPTAATGSLAIVVFAFPFVLVLATYLFFR